LASYTFNKDSTPPMPGAGLDREQRLRNDPAGFARALTSGTAWERFCEGLRSAGAAILRPEEALSATDLAESFQMLPAGTRRVSAGIDPRPPA
jgi:hypothetical protein